MQEEVEGVKRTANNQGPWDKKERYHFQVNIQNKWIVEMVSLEKVIVLISS